MALREFLRDLYGWLFEGNPLAAKHLGVLAVFAVLLLLLIVACVAARKYNRALTKWRLAGGIRGVAEPGSLPYSDRLPSHRWQKVKRGRGHRSHGQHPPHESVQDP